MTYTRTQLLFLSDGLGVNCPLVAVLRAELDGGNRQTFAFRRQGSPLSVLALDPVRGEQPRQFLDGLLAARDQERRKLPAGDRMTWEERDQALQRQDLGRLWDVAAAPWPRTCVGLWLRAGFLGQRELRDRLKLTLNGGDPEGWNYEEPFVVAAVCEIAVRKLFRVAPDAQAVTEFVTEMRGRIRSTAPPGQQVCEAVIRDAFRDPGVDFTHVSSAELFRATAVVAGTAVRTLRLDEAAIDEMIAEGERLTFQAGRHPPLAPPASENGAARPAHGTSSHSEVTVARPVAALTAIPRLARQVNRCKRWCAGARAAARTHARAPQPPRHRRAGQPQRTAGSTPHPMRGPEGPRWEPMSTLQKTSSAPLSQ